MIIVIVSTKRPGRQITLDWLKRADLNQQTVIVVNPGEADDYHFWKDDVIDIVEVPATVNPQIGAVRSWIIQNIDSHDNVCLLDDDLRFYKRTAEDWHLSNAESDDLKAMFNWMDFTLTTNSECGQVGISPREGNKFFKVPIEFNTRIMRCMAFNLPRLKKAKVEFHDVLMEDFDLSLQLLTQGYNNQLITIYAQNQDSSNQAGGCSTYRTQQMQADSARMLAKKFPQFVQTVERETKYAWGDWGKRLDVRVQWKQAYKYGLAQREKDL